MPTFTPSAPASLRSRAASGVAMFPATTSTVSGSVSLSRRTVSSPLFVWPWAVSITMASTWRSASSWARAMALSPTPTAAAQRSLPNLSLVAFGYAMAFWMSLTVSSPASAPFSSSTGSFSTRCSWRMALASSSVVPRGAVWSGARVMSS